MRDEATAVFAADATGRLSGIPGIAAVTAGPGLTNALTALRNAQLAHSPLVLIAGAAPTMLKGRGALQDIDQMATAAPHVKHARTVRRVRDLGPATAEAISLARSGVPGPVLIECPVDLLYPEHTVREWYAAAGGKGRSLTDRALRLYLDRHVGRMFAGAATATAPPLHEVLPPEPSGATVRKAAALLAGAERPLLLVGSQAVSLADETAAIAASIGRLGVPLYLSGMARGLLGRDHPLQLRQQRRAALKESDLVILAGVPCDFRLDYGRHLRRGSRIIAANRSRREAKLNCRPTILAESDAGRFLRRLAEVLPGEGGRWRAWRETLQARDSERQHEIEQQAGERGEFVNPLRLCRAIEAVMADDALLVADGGDFVGTASYTIRPRTPLGWLDPGVFGTLGVGAGFGIGARIAHPDREVWILFGDGAVGWSLSEFDSLVRHGLPVIAVVGNDGGWTQIAREQVKLLGDDVGTVLRRTAYHEVVRGFGAEGILVREESELESALERARAVARAGRPVLVNVWLDRTGFREGSISM